MSLATNTTPVDMDISVHDGNEQIGNANPITTSQSMNEPTAQIDKLILSPQKSTDVSDYSDVEHDLNVCEISHRKILTNLAAARTELVSGAHSFSERGGRDAMFSTIQTCSVIP